MSNKLFTDNVTLLYERAREMEVPVKYVLIHFENSDQIDDYHNGQFFTYFQLIRQLRDRGMDINEMWDFIKEYTLGDSISIDEMIPMYFHSIYPEGIEFDRQTPTIEEFNKQLIFGKEMDDLSESIKLMFKDEPINPFTTLRNSYNSYNTIWKRNFIASMNGDVRELNKLIDADKNINNYSPLPYDDFDIDNVTMIYKASYEFNPLNAIFNNSRTSFRAPFIQLNNNGKRLYKIYRGKSSTQVTNYDNISVPSQLASDPFTLYVNLWMGESSDLEEDEAYQGNKSSFKLVTVKWTNGELIYTVPSPKNEDVDVNDILKRLHEHIDTDIPREDSIKITRISGSFSIFYTQPNVFAFIDTIMNDPDFNVFFYLDEASTFVHSMKFRYIGTSLNTKLKSIDTLQAKITARKAYRGKRVNTNEGEITLSKRSNTPYVTVEFERAGNERLVDDFVSILSSLLSKLQITQDEILDRYARVVPGFDDYIESLPRIPPEISDVQGPPPMKTLVGTEYDPMKPENRGRYLRKFGADLFVRGYAKKCNRITQPLIINETDIEYWKNKRTIGRYGPENRQIVKFPPEDPFYTAVCPGDVYKNIGLMENKILKNKDRYPYILCCYKENQFKNANSITSIVYKGGTKELRGEVATPISTDRILTIGRLAILPTTLDNFFNRLIVGHIFRLGVQIGSNSAIHAVAFALDKGYRMSPFKDRYVSRLRRRMSLYHPSLYKQEMSDYSDNEIVEQLRSEDVFFDPLLFYRGLEELYDCSIFVFNLSGKSKEDGTEISFLDLPVHKLFYARPRNRKNIVILLRHWGNGTDGLLHPHCELMISELKGEETLYFKPTRHVALHNALWGAFDFVQQTLTWKLDGGISTYLNTYSIVNWADVFGDRADGQYIDENGKMRLVRLKGDIFVSIPPSQPLNVEEFSLEEAGTKLPSIVTLTRVFGPYECVTADENGVTGLTFSMGDISIYCQCTHSPVTDDMCIVERNDALVIPLENVESPLNRYKVLEKVRSYLTQIMKYLYLVDGKGEIDDFLERTLRNYEGEIDSLELYNIDDVHEILPVGSVEEILEELTEQGLAIDGKLPVYDDEMMEGMRYLIETFSKNLVDVEYDEKELRVLRDYYSTKSDFSVDHDREFLLVSLNEYTSWYSSYKIPSVLKQRDIQNLKNDIQSRLVPLAFMYTEPYIYRRSENTVIRNNFNVAENNYYIIQSVAEGDVLRALNVILTWKREKRNLGHRARPLSEEPPTYAVYGIAPGGGMILKEGSEEMENKVLDYFYSGLHIYAAMLPL